MKRRWKWTPKQLARSTQVEKIVNELKEYWPLTLRQIYYQLVAKNLIGNTKSQYTMLSTLIKQMRLDGVLPWDVIEDRTRRVSGKRGFDNPVQFINQQVKGFLKGYSRCLVQDQENYVEIWVEKDALSRIFENIAWTYCIRCVTCKGFMSATFINDYALRAKKAQAQGQQPVVLYFGDLDPSGVKMFESTQDSLWFEHDLKDIEYQRIALNPEQVKEYNLPISVDAIKEKDPRTPDYRKKYGNVAVELDALHPKLLEDLTTNALAEVLDIELMLVHQDLQKKDQAKIEELKSKVQEVCRQAGYLF
ncbi:MAG: hypothetical protein GWP10_07470 [Nitrospiraceae bacterium]|nr:hypothetical protein [Nitrospiraceae bacterium]